MTDITARAALDKAIYNQATFFGKSYPDEVKRAKERMEEIETTGCKNHQAYASHCLDCWKVYFEKEPERMITGDVMSEFIRTLQLLLERNDG